MKHHLALISLLATAIQVPLAHGSMADMWNGLASDRPHPAVVRVVVSEGQTMSLGSGTLVSVRGRHGLVVTNWHVVRDAKGPINVIFPDGFRSGASLLGTDADWDLAALAIWRPNVQPVELSRRSPQLDDSLTIAGYGSGNYRSASGRCVQYISPGANHPFEMLELSAAARDGDSGGPIFNDQGELAGVLFGAARGRTAGSYCGRVARFLNSVAPRFDDLSNPPSDTMIAQDLPTPPVTAEASPPLAHEVAMTGSHPAPDYGWQPSQDVPQRRDLQPARPTRRRPLPLASIPDPTAEQPVGPPSDPVNEISLEDHFSSDAPSLPGSMASVSPTGPPPTAAAGQDSDTPAESSNLMGGTVFEQAKTFLATFGLVAIVFQLLKVAGAIQRRPRRRRRSVRRVPQPVRRRVVRRVRTW